MINQEIIGYLVPYIVFIVFLLGLAIYIFAHLAGKIRGLNKEHCELQKRYDRELHHRKSSEVRLGKIGENLAPFVAGWPWDPKNFRFLGNPVDGIQFNKDGIIFVEIKTGKARLSKSQKAHRDLVNAGKVSFATFKITEAGTKLVQEGEDL